MENARLLNEEQPAYTGDTKWRSVFSPDRPRKMNAVPMLINWLLPWILFCFTFFAWSFKFHFSNGSKLPYLFGLLIVIALVPTMIHMHLRNRDLDPSWLTYSTIVFLLAVIAGSMAGDANYHANMWPYYKWESLQAYPMVDVGRELGINVQDGGRMYFGANSYIATEKSWHFKDGTVYCVAPILSKAGMQTSTYDFWAVGTDCCAEDAADFRCGEFANPSARSGLRLLDAGLLSHYRLAVDQASALWGIHSTTPVFFTWTQDPLDDINAYLGRGWQNAMISCIIALTVSAVLLNVAVFKFMWIGRRANKPTTEDV